MQNFDHNQLDYSVVVLYIRTILNFIALFIFPNSPILCNEM